MPLPEDWMCRFVTLKAGSGLLLLLLLLLYRFGTTSGKLRPVPARDAARMILRCMMICSNDDGIMDDAGRRDFAVGLGMGRDCASPFAFGDREEKNWRTAWKASFRLPP